MDTELKRSQQRVRAAEIANGVLGCTRPSIACRWEVILPSSSAHLECGVQLWAPPYKGDMDITEKKCPLFSVPPQSLPFPPPIPTTPSLLPLAIVLPDIPLFPPLPTFSSPHPQPCDPPCSPPPPFLHCLYNFDPLGPCLACSTPRRALALFSSPGHSLRGQEPEVTSEEQRVALSWPAGHIQMLNSRVPR